MPEFLAGLVAEHGFEHVGDVEAPASYKANPLANGDDDEALLHFTDLTTSTYRGFTRLSGCERGRGAVGPVF